MCVSEIDIASVGNDYVPYITKTLQLDNNKINYSYRSPVALLQKHSTTIFPSQPAIEKIDTYVGGDHGKGAFTMMLIVIVCYENKEPSFYEVLIG